MSGNGGGGIDASLCRTFWFWFSSSFFLSFSFLFLLPFSSFFVLAVDQASKQNSVDR